MNDELLLAALHHRGKPSMASDVYDTAIGLGRHAGWSRQQLSECSAQKVAKQLRRMSNESIVVAAGTAKENGNDRLLWRPVDGFQLNFPIPFPPEPPPEHPLDELTRPQALAVFDTTDNLLLELQRQRRELRTFMDRQDDELARIRERVKRTLAAVGLGETPT